MGTKPYKRRKYFIKKEFQGKFILLFLGIATLGGVLSLAGFTFFSVKKIEYLVYSIHIPSKRLKEIIMNEMLYSNLLSLLFVILATLVTIRWLTMRISGPLYRIKKDLESIRDGNLSFVITLRYRDEFKDFASELNFFVEKFRRAFSSLKHQTEIVDKYLRDIERNSQRIDLIKLRAHQIVSQTEEMEEILSQFKTE